VTGQRIKEIPMEVSKPKSADAKPFFICQRKDNGQYLWIAFEVWEDRHEVAEAYKFSSVPQIVDFFEWQGREIEKYDIVKVEYVLTTVKPPYATRASYLKSLKKGLAHRL
jgi:hypothetical protein